MRTPASKMNRGILTLLLCAFVILNALQWHQNLIEAKTQRLQFLTGLAAMYPERFSRQEIVQAELRLDKTLLDAEKKRITVGISRADLTQLESEIQQLEAEIPQLPVHAPHNP